MAYYQQVGRAGRALDDALAVLLPAEADERIWEYFATAGIPDEHQVERILDALGEEPQTVPALEAATGMRRGRLESTLKILAVDEAVERRAGGWVATGKAWYFDDAKWAALRKVRAAEADLMRSLRARRGLPHAASSSRPSTTRTPRPCGRCSVCTGELPAPGAEPDRGHRRRRRPVLPGPGRRRRAPQAVGRRACRATRARSASPSPGRALAFADDPAWAEQLGRMWQQDAPASPEVLAAMVQVLTRWSKSWQRPVAVVPMPSRRYPALVGSVAEHIARVGRLPLVDALAVSGPAPAVDASSSTRAQDLLRTTTLQPGVSFDGPVLLVDDRIRSRWTLTVAASLLAEAGATTVLPLALHQLP